MLHLPTAAVASGDAGIEDRDMLYLPGSLCVHALTGGRESLSVQEFYTACSKDWIFRDLAVCMCVRALEVAE